MLSVYLCSIIIKAGMPIKGKTVYMAWEGWCELRNTGVFCEL